MQGLWFGVTGRVRPPRRAWAVIPALVLALALSPPAAGRARHRHRHSPSATVELDQPAYTAHESQGVLTITIVRSGNLSGQQHVGYGVKQQDGQNGIDFDVVPSTYITMQPGQRTYSFSVRIIDRGMHAPPVHALAYLYGAWPGKLGRNHNSLITILRDDPLQPRDPANPLGVPGPYNGNLIAGAKLYVDPDSGAAKAERRYARSRPSWASALGVIAGEPGAHRFYMWNIGSHVAGRVAHYLEQTQVRQPGTTVMLSTYSLVHGQCGYTATPRIKTRYDNFIKHVADGIGNFNVVFFLELDSLITAPCLDRRELAIRDAELRYAIAALEADPHVVVYLDGGAADALSARRQARLLLNAGVRHAQGFFLNSTHFDWTSTELHYGQQISSLTGGAHFIINTGENGRGPLRPRNRVRYGNEVLCNPPGRGLGPLSVSDDTAQQTGYADDDGLLWFSNPGGSGGRCRRGAPPNGVFWPAYAVMLARNWVDRVGGPRVPVALTAKAQARAWR